MYCFIFALLGWKDVKRVEHGTQNKLLQSIFALGRSRNCIPGHFLLFLNKQISNLKMHGFATSKTRQKDVRVLSFDCFWIIMKMVPKIMTTSRQSRQCYSQILSGSIDSLTLSVLWNVTKSNILMPLQRFQESSEICPCAAKKATNRKEILRFIAWSTGATPFRV